MVCMSTIKEVRAMKARKSSVVSCGHYVLRGQLIVRKNSRWLCQACALGFQPDICSCCRSAS